MTNLILQKVKLNWKNQLYKRNSVFSLMDWSFISDILSPDHLQHPTKEWDLSVQLGPDPFTSYFTPRVLGPNKEAAAHFRSHSESRPLQNHSLNHLVSSSFTHKPPLQDCGWTRKVRVSAPEILPVEAQRGSNYIEEKNEVLIINSAYSLQQNGTTGWLEA